MLTYLLQRPRTALGVFLSLVLLVWLLVPSSHRITNYPTRGSTIVSFGDSLVSGVGVTDGRNFTTLLSERTSVEIRNEGVSGDTTAMGLARIDDVLALDPKIVIVLLGGNDALRRVDPDVTFSNLSEIVERLQARGAGVLLVAPPGGIFYADTYSKNYKALAEKYGVAYVPNILKGLLGDREYMADTLHPNNRGHSVMADRIEPLLRTLLRGA